MNLHFSLVALKQLEVSLHPPSSIFPSSISPSIIPPSRNPPCRLLGQFDYLNIKNSSAFRNYDRMTGWQDDRQEYDRQKTLDKYMIKNIFHLQEGACSEKNSRMTAMENSSKNASTYLLNLSIVPLSETSPFRAGTALQAMRRYIFSDSQSENLFHFFTEIF